MARLVFYLLASLLLLTAGEVYSKSLERITNGLTAAKGQFPYIVGLEFQRFGASQWCGGSIIANDWILTAAHCTEGVQRVTIYYGSTKRKQAQVVVQIEARGNIILHPHFAMTNVINNDIALIHSKWVDFTDDIQSIDLPRSDQRGESFDGVWTTATGWGKTRDHSWYPSSQLLYVYLKIIANSECSSVYGNIPAGVLCVSTQVEQSICSGDSGGPLVANKENILVGVSSFVHFTGCESGKPAGFTRVSEYLDWIHEISGVTS